MKKIFSVLIVACLVLSLVPFGEAKINRIEPKLRVCVDYLNKNTDVRNPMQKCESLEAEEIDCENFLKVEGIDSPEDKCGRFFKIGGDMIKERNFISDEISEQIPEWELKKVDRLIRSRPESTGKINELVSSLDGDQAKIFVSMTRAGQKELIDKDVGQARDDLAKYQISSRERVYTKRVITAEKTAQIRGRFVEASEQFVQAKNSYQDKKTQFLDLRLV